MVPIKTIKSKLRIIPKSLQMLLMAKTLYLIWDTDNFICLVLYVVEPMKNDSGSVLPQTESPDTLTSLNRLD